ncbi:BPSS1780 family membrane protein [Chitinilyticum litopenaei]|uniref:BPSS1780 family membrane protein n=1 Tax=Chitinilyticum litopenaei TaxID=1121276 RepID=UPI000425DBE1|nr:BPSS1780 family membrane protein [Chitinilyticum litopenaei]
MDQTDLIIDNQLEPRRRRVIDCWQWLAAAFALFRGAPLAWLALSSLLIVMTLIVMLIPVLGAIVSAVLMPGLLASFVAAAREQQNTGRTPQIADLFAGLRHQPVPLIRVGLYYFVLMTVVMLLLTQLVEATLPAELLAKLNDPKTSPEQIPELLAYWPLALTIFASLLLVYSSYFFAPQLVLLQGLRPGEAMKLSLLAFWRNLLPLCAMGVLGLGLIVIGSLPWLLGLLVVFPVLMLTNYTIYASVFEPNSTIPTGVSA